MSTRVDSCSESRHWAGHVRPSVLVVLVFLGTLVLGVHPGPAEAQKITETYVGGRGELSTAQAAELNFSSQYELGSRLATIASAMEAGGCL